MKSFSRAASIIVMLAGSLVLLGWILNIPALRSILPELSSMKVNTAAAFVLAGLALWLLLKEPATPPARRAAQVFALTIALLGVLTIGEYVFGWELGIDQWLFKDSPTGVGTLTPGRMSPPSALSFLFLGVALLLLDRGTPLGDRWANFLALLIALLSGVALLGYIYGAASLYSIGSNTQIEVHTALPTLLTFIVAAAGLLCARPNSGPTAIISSENAGGFMARRLLPGAIILPVILGWLSLQGQRASLYGTELDLALMVSSSIVVFVSAIWWNARLLNQTDAELKLAQAAGLRQSEERLRYVIWATRDAIWDRDLTRSEILWNESLRKLLHYRDDEIESSVAWWEQHIHPDDRNKVVRSIQMILDTRQHLWSKEYRFQRADGSYANVFDRGYILYDQDSGKPQRMIGAMADFSEQKRIEQALRQSEELFAKAFSASPAGIILTRKADGRLIEANDAYLKMVEYSRSQALGQTTLELGVISPEDRARLLQMFDEQGTVRDFEYWTRTKSGQLRAVLTSLEQVEVEGTTCFLAVIYDITERKQAEQALAEQAIQLSDQAALLELTHETVIVRDMNSVITFWNRGAEEMYGWTQAEALGKITHSFLKTRFPGSPDNVQGELLWAGRWEGELIHTARSGRKIVVVSRQVIQRNEHGQPKAILEINSDITERKQAEEALQKANVNLKRSVAELDQRNHEIALLNELGNLLQTCNSLEEADSTISQLAPKLFPDSPGALYMINASGNQMEVVSAWKTLLPREHKFRLQNCLAVRNKELHYVDANNQNLQCRHVINSSCSSICVPLTAQHGEVIGVFHLERSQPETLPAAEVRGDFTSAEKELATAVADTIALALTNLKLRETLRIQSIRDPLTGLYNRRFMEESLERELRRAARSRLPLGIIMLDLDHFKHFNDTFSHAAGDTLLRELGRFLQSHIRAGDIACRYGGEEFLLLLPEASLEITKQRAEKLCSDVRDMQVQHRGILLGNITLSLGVAIFPDHGQEAEDVLRAADAALYHAKRAGRNRVAVARRTSKKLSR